jgi:hypothetical protein
MACYNSVMEVIINLFEKHDEDIKKQLLLPINKATDRAKMFTGKSQPPMCRIRRKHKQMNAIIWPSFSHHQETRDENIHVILCLQITLVCY